VSFSQSVEQIKKNTAYYWGEGTGTTSKKADDEALSELINRIAVNVESSFTNHTQQLTQNGKIDFHQSVNNVIKTHSTATIKNTEILTWGEEPDVHVFRYVKKSEVYRIFAERERKVKIFVEEAQEAEAKYQIADALRNYYWALMLLQSLPSSESVTATFENREQKLDVYLPKKINELFGSLQFSITGREKDGSITQYILNITSNGHLVTNCEYSFFDGRNWSVPVAAKDGRGVAELSGDTALHRDLRIKIEYAFENEWNIDREVYDVLSKLEPITFNQKNYITVPISKNYNLTNSNKIGEHNSNTGNAVKGNTISNQTSDAVAYVDNTLYLPMLQRVETAIRTKKYESVRDCFTDEGFDIFTQLIQYGQASIIQQPHYSFVKFEDGILARSLPMKFSFKNNRREFVEDVVFNISQSEGKIRSLSFALPKDECNDILTNEKWNEYSRMAVINFLENYKTAYALKRLDYLESIFSDNALIIVGKMVKNYAPKDGSVSLIPEKTQLTKYSKEQYMKNLANAFRSNEYVNLKFTDTDVIRAGKGGEIYGIQLKQDYFSTTYGDKGYLFLMIDLNKPEEPVIHVRTWQPEKDPNFGLYNITNF
jgi:hypothetical protein